MEIILREDIENLGNRGEVVKVAAGYARNFLLPRQMAYLCTPDSEKQIESERKRRSVRELKKVEELKSAAQLLKGNEPRE